MRFELEEPAPADGGWFIQKYDLVNTLNTATTLQWKSLLTRSLMRISMKREK